MGVVLSFLQGPSPSEVLSEDPAPLSKYLACNSKVAVTPKTSVQEYGGLDLSGSGCTNQPRDPSQLYCKEKKGTFTIIKRGKTELLECY